MDGLPKKKRGRSMRRSGCKQRDGGFCPARALRLDRTKLPSCSAAELGPFAASQNGPADSPRRRLRDRNCSASAGALASTQVADQSPPSHCSGASSEREEKRASLEGPFRYSSFDARSGGPVTPPL